MRIPAHHSACYRNNCYNSYFSEGTSLATLEQGRPNGTHDYINGEINLFFNHSAPSSELNNLTSTESAPEGPRTMLKRVSSRIINSQAPTLQRQPSLLRPKSDSDSTTTTSSDQQHVHFSHSTHSSLEIEEKPSKKTKRCSKFRKYIIGTMPAWERQLNEMENFWGAVLRFWDSFFRGIGQVRTSFKDHAIDLY